MSKNTSTGLAGLAALALLLASASALAAEAVPVSLSPAQIAEVAIPSVVLIQTATGLGSGFVVTKEGRIATNLHVIAGSRSATVILSDHRKFSEVEVLASDVKHDLAVLQIRAADLRPLPLGDSAQVRPGERVVAIGHPLGLGNTVSDGLVSAVRELSPTLSVLQISAPISPGSSGGPILNDRGQVIGISTLVVTEGQNLAFGMPVNQLKALLANAGPGTPIASWSAPSLNDRKIPKHDLTILAGCGPAEQQEVERRIEAAITSGAPLYNDGHHEACYRIYSGAALEIDRKVKGCEGVRQALIEGIRRSDSIDNYTKKAWAMRDAFDGVLDAISRGHVAAPEPPSLALPAAPPRAVPRHPLSLLDGCSIAKLLTIAKGIEGAIESGAPLYNDGKLEACYRIYEGAALDLTRKVQGCGGPKGALEAGLREAAKRRTYGNKAWAMRDAFDGLMGVIARRLEK